MMYDTVESVRNDLALRYRTGQFVKDKSGIKVIEIVNANFVADEPLIFGAVNEDYVNRELEWYKSMSLNVNDIPGETPAIWKQVADKNGFINSNYGWCIFSEENNYQFAHVVTELQDRPDSRRAVMIYTRPKMWGDHIKDGRSDFMCTNAVQYIYRDGAVDAIVQMRSNDAWAGYRNDYAWQKWVLEELVATLNKHCEGRQHNVGKIYWNVGSLHLYERQFYLVDHYIQTGDTHITKDEYVKLYSMA